MPKIVCLDCRTEYQIESNEVYCVDMAWDPPQPYRITACDMWVCPGCGKKILAGFAPHGYEHYQDEFNKLLEKITGEDVTLRIVHNWRGRENLINRIIGEEGHVNVIYNYERAQVREKDV